MDTDQSQVIVTMGATAGAIQVHHRDFPEIRAHGQDAADAATQLVNQLTRALDSALTTWRRETIERAIQDVKMYRPEEH
ncbi:MAG: hypothetical protein ABI353_14235 [Isosphaeraceae bacterium]